jgi:exonuclease III
MCNLKNLVVMSWNVRGLGDSEKCNLVRESIASIAPNVACIQESKLHDITTFKAHSFLPTCLAVKFMHIPAAGTRGGVITAWNPDVLHLTSYAVHHHALTVHLRLLASNSDIHITNVYAPSDHRDTPAFLDILLEIGASISGPWLIVGDFNLIRDAKDKNTGTVNQLLCNQFNDVIHNLSLAELPLLDCLYTWSNKRRSPILARLDRAFTNATFNNVFPSALLTSSVRITSDHKPIIATMSTTVPKSNSFRFENAWLKKPGFLPSILPAWRCLSGSTDAAGRLASCLKSTRSAVKVWARRNRAPPQILPNCKFIILMFDFLEEERWLSDAEMQVRELCRNRLQQHIKEMAAYWKQRGKQRAIREGVVV